jgi:predicted TIM-barrel fold metal-dependent hydrolase
MLKLRRNGMLPEPPLADPPKIAVKPRQKAPVGASDCHFHIFGPRDKYPMLPSRFYTPSPEANQKNYQVMADTLGLQRHVIVNPTPYGADHRCTAEAIEIFGRDRARGVAVINDSYSDETLRELAESGFCAARVTSVLTNSTPVDELKAVVRRIEPIGWHLELYVYGEELPGLEKTLLALPVPVVIDHMGRVPTNLGINSPEFQTMLRLMDSGKIWTKLCGYRSSTDGPPYADLLAPARKIIETAPDRCVWGTDWPHPRLKGPMLPNDGNLLDLLYEWAPDAKHAQRILVDNPAQLYHFAP